MISMIRLFHVSVPTLSIVRLLHFLLAQSTKKEERKPPRQMLRRSIPARRAPPQYFAEFVRHIDAKFAAIDTKLAEAKKDSDAKFAEAKKDSDAKFAAIDTKLAEAKKDSDTKFADMATRIDVSHAWYKIFQASASVLVGVVAFVTFDRNRHTVETEKRWNEMTTETEKRWGEYRRDSTEAKAVADSSLQILAGFMSSDMAARRAKKSVAESKT
jgi:hypothetical protein